MRALLTKLLRSLAYIGAALVIVLAIAVGIFRMMLPQLPAYQDEIKAWASTAIGMQVDFTDMNARWRFTGPELSFFNAGLSHADTGAKILTAAEVDIGIGFLRLITDQELVVDQVIIRDTALQLSRNAAGKWTVQDIVLDDLLGREPAAQGGDLVIIGENIDIEYRHPPSGQLVPLLVRSAVVRRDSDELSVDAGVGLPMSFGNSIDISANQLVADGINDVWRVYIEGEGLLLGGWSRLQPPGWPQIASGAANLSVWLQISNGGIEGATANVDVSDVLPIDPVSASPFNVTGSLEFSAEPEGWLLAANQFRIATPRKSWPESSLLLRVLNDVGDGGGLRASATFFDLDDLRLIYAWLPSEQQAELQRYAPSGVLRNASIDIAGLEGEDRRIDVSADLDGVGMVAGGDWPGVKNFSGRLRAGRDGGRLEITSRGVIVDAPTYLPEPVMMEAANGTILWRRNQNGITVLSDNVTVENADLSSQMSLQLSIPHGDGSAFIDAESTWSVRDVTTVPRYLPLTGVAPKLREWLTNALVAGRVTDGVMRINGALDNFPFDDGNGNFRVAARLEDATLKFADNWPAPQFSHLDVVAEGARLYSVENSAINLGNQVEDATVEIADLRDPVLTIEAFATGSLQSIRNYAMQSPIDAALGGQLDRVTVDGDASYDLSITYPIRNKENYDFSTRIRATDGTVRITGFPAPISELNGIVNVSRDAVSSEQLVGQFLGNTADLILSRNADRNAAHGVQLDASGITTAADVEAGFGIDLGAIVEGTTDYRARVHFPNGAAPEPGKLQVVVESELAGIAINVPSPLGKDAGAAMPLVAEITFPEAEQILTSGTLNGGVAWQARFLKTSGSWDFDRGMLAVGGAAATDPDVRGLHIIGATAELPLHDWLSLGRRSDREAGFGERIRYIDLDVEHLQVLGQDYADHKLVVNRSGRDWVVQIRGELADGVVTVPYDFSSSRPMALDMVRLTLPGNEGSEADSASTLDPRSLPALVIEAEEFVLGGRHFGQLSAEFARTERGLESTALAARDATFTIEGAAGWVMDAAEADGQRTYIDATLKSSDVLQTLNRLDYEPGVSAEFMEISLQLKWSGGPRKDFMSDIDGAVSVNVGEGTLTEVEPGAGRMFGLMSFAALPRRLSLDFSDVFESGFSFDRITGNFRLQDGDAFTCDLNLTGPGADVGIVGRAGLVNRDYDQTAIISANVGNTLPVVGLMAGGPQVAAALLLFSQIFKKPLKDMGQIYYAVEGSWDDPVIDNAEPEQFAHTSDVAGCLEAVN